MIANNKKSSIPFVDSNQPELRPSSDSSSSSSRPNHYSNTLPRKKKESILQKISITSRRSLSWLPGVHDAHHRQQQDPQPHSITASSGTSVSSRSSTDQNNHQSTKGDHHASKTSIGKGIRSVARTVKKSLHQFDRPRSILGDDRLPSNDQQDPKARNSLQRQNRQQDTHPLNTQSSPPSSPNQRTRAVSTSEVYQSSSSNRSREGRIGQPRQSMDRSSPSQPFEPNRVGPSSSPQPSPKKPRPQSAVQLGSVPSTRIANRQQYQHLSWNAQTPVGSLPMAASLLAAPSPPPVDHSTFLAIIPGPKSNAAVPSLAVVPPAASQSVEPPALTAASMGVEPALSRRVSLTSSAGGGNSNDGNSFTFIQTPSVKHNAPSPVTPISPAPSGLGSPEWHEIVGQSTTLESVNSRPPLVSMSTTISLVQSCVAERGSINELDEIVEQEQSIGYHVAESQEQSTPSGALESSIVPSLEIESPRSESRKRKVTSLALTGPYEAENKTNQTELDSSEGVVRQNKVLRSMDQPFSSSKTWTEIGMNHETSHSLSLLTVNQTTTTQHLIHRLGSSTPPSKNRKNSTKSKSSPSTNLSSISKSSNHSRRPHDNRNGNEIWNLTIVSTVVGVVIIAAVLIGSTNLSNLNGKSWIGNLIKKI